jgi:hypothetical protein
MPRVLARHVLSPKLALHPIEGWLEQATTAYLNCPLDMLHMLWHSHPE